MSIFNNGIVLTDEELAALPIDIMAVWLDQWEEARDKDAHALRQAEEGYEPSWIDVYEDDLQFKYFGTVGPLHLVG